MIPLNPVTDNNDIVVTKGLISQTINVVDEVKQKHFRDILLTNANTVDGQENVANYFGVRTEWNRLTMSWYGTESEPTGFKRYY
jgi:hypothetical protein